MKTSSLARMTLLMVSALACDGQQYVSPQTIALVVSDDATRSQRVNRCHFVPVLLGSQVKFRYVVASGLRATLTLTRDEVAVEFEGAAGTEAFRVYTSDMEVEGTRLSAERPPEGYSVELESGCTPDGEYR